MSPILEVAEVSVSPIRSSKVGSKDMCSAPMKAPCVTVTTTQGVFTSSSSGSFHQLQQRRLAGIPRFARVRARVRTWNFAAGIMVGVIENT